MRWRPILAKPLPSLSLAAPPYQRGRCAFATASPGAMRHRVPVLGTHVVALVTCQVEGGIIGTPVETLNCPRLCLCGFSQKGLRFL
jgi:hypothetical protein